jgi:hypothetical protein
MISERLVASRFCGGVDLREQVVFDGDGDPLHPIIPLRRRV